MVLIFIHIVAHIKSAFSFIVIFHGINDYSLVIHSPVYGHQHCYHFLIIMNKTVMLFYKSFFLACIFISLEYIPNSEIIEFIR